MYRKNAWENLAEDEKEQLSAFAKDYMAFLNNGKTERECVAEGVRQAEAKGFKNLMDVVKNGETLKAGDRVYRAWMNKDIMLFIIGEKPMECGMNILGAHIDSPRIDIKQNPLYEDEHLAYLDTHYYGGIKNYQWVTLPLAMHGVVAKKDGTVVDINVGDDEGDPVFCVSDLLIHLASQQMDKKGNKIVEGEDLDILIGNRPLSIDGEDAEREAAGSEGAESKDAAKEPVKAFALKLLADKYGIEEADFLSAEIEMVPAGRARELGFDRSMVIGYGQDDRVCAYTSLIAQLEAPAGLAKTAVTVLVDKEEIGSVGATGMASNFFENTIAEIMELAGEGGMLPLRRALSASSMLSSDVSAGFDPAYASVFEPKNAAFLGRGLVFNKYTGARGKSGSNDASAEYVARVRRVMDDAGVSFQTAELGKVDAGGGGTIAYLPAKYGMDVIDSGVAVLSMHAPWEVTSKADIYEAYKGYLAFLKNA